MILDDLLAAARAGRIELDPFDYSAFFPIAAFLGGAVLPVNVTINNDSDFLARYTALSAWSAVGIPVPTPDYLVTYFDSGSGRNLQDQAQHVANVAGTAQLPYLWPEPKLLKGSSTFVVTLANRTAIPADVFMTFSGFKIYYYGSWNRDTAFKF